VPQSDADPSSDLEAARDVASVHRDSIECLPCRAQAHWGLGNVRYSFVCKFYVGGGTDVYDELLESYVLI